MVCVWCGIAMERVNRAMELFPHAEEVELVHRSFRLMPDYADGESTDFREFMRDQRGYPEDRVTDVVARVEGMAHADGVSEYHVEGIRVGNSTLAHEFLAWATDQGRHKDAWDLIFRRHYADRLDIWTVEDLLALARELELDEDAAREALEDRRYRAQVEADHAEVLQLGGSGVPFIVIDRRFAVSGAQAPEVLASALKQAWDSRTEVTHV